MTHNNQIKTGNTMGYNHQLVKVVELVPSYNMARCQNPRTTEEYQVTLSQRSHATWPQVGEYWVIDRSAGPWNFAQKVTAPTPPVATGVVTNGTAADLLAQMFQKNGLATDSTTKINAPTLTGHTTPGAKAIATALVALGHVVDNTVVPSDTSATVANSTAAHEPTNSNNTRSNSTATSQPTNNGNTRTHTTNSPPTITDFNNLVDTVNNQNTVDNNTAISLDALITDHNSLVTTVNNINTVTNNTNTSLDQLITDHNTLVAQFNALKTVVDALLS